jgi:hypothetical protein
MTALLPTAAVAREVGLADLPGIGLDELLLRAALQTRIDRKYVLDADRLPRLLAALDGIARVLDIDGRRWFGYLSTYFDTPGLDAFHLAGRGRRRRFKVRTRVYRDSGDAWLEVKTRGPRGTTVKDRLPYPLAAAGTLTAAGQEFVAGVLAARHVPGVEVAALAPALHTRYERATVVVDGPGGDSRATFDAELAWRRPGEPWQPAAPGRLIVETKGGATPSALDRALWRGGTRPSRVSKYGTGLTSLGDLPELKWHRVLERELQPVG